MGDVAVQARRQRRGYAQLRDRLGALRVPGILRGPIRRYRRLLEEAIALTHTIADKAHAQKGGQVRLLVARLRVNKRTRHRVAGTLGVTSC
jgi:hypothetical protein